MRGFSDSRAVLGIDLSLTGGLGLCAVPLSWDLDWRNVRAAVLVADSAEKRGAQLRWLAHRTVDFAKDNRITHAWVEGYVPSGRAFGIHKLAEVGGVVRLALLEGLSIEVETAPLSSARKLLLGKIPKGKGLAKKVSHESVEAIARRKLDGNTADAFIIANFGLAELGETFVGVAA